ncbi:uncharacterized protein [Haliotis asinina]|uniref:uncharacterized protein n=1 Tax=Haliotis asinina TaxID=109174 RepID=UPI0035318BAF
MTMFNNGFLLVFVAVLAPSLGSQPAPNELPDKLNQTLNALTQAKSDFQCIFDVSDEQCPCQTPGDPSCFETDLENINSTLCELIANLTALLKAQPTDCPALEGCAAVVTGNYSDELSVVDPVGTILPSLRADNIVNCLAICGDNDTFYSIFYITNAMAATISELVFPGASDTPLYNEDENAEEIVRVILAQWADCQKGCAPGKEPGYSPDLNQEINERIYFIDCKEIKCVNTDGSDVTTRVMFSMNIVSFDVIDGDRTLFCDGAGGLWIYNNATDCFKLVECNTERCTDIKINRCNDLAYVGYSGNK